MITIKHHPNGGMTCKDTSHKYGHACGYCMGCIKPHYPVPAIRGWNYIQPPNGGGVKGDCVRIGAWFVDWSRGSIEVYNWTS